MGTRTSRRAALATLAATGLLATGYGTSVALAGDDQNGGTPPSTTQQTERRADDDYQSTLKLSDGRKVQVKLVKGTGVRERHTTADSTEWSAWKTLYKSKADLCQGVGLEEKNGTVSLIADFGLYCSDGEPPQESVAGVGTGNLTKWDINMTEGFDGWQDTSITDEGDKVVFLYNSDAGLYTLRWEGGNGGFGKVDGPRD